MTTVEEITDIIEALIEKHKAGGCVRCVFDNRGTWEHPCNVCKRSKRDYWRANDDVR